MPDFIRSGNVEAKELVGGQRFHSRWTPRGLADRETRAGLGESQEGLRTFDFQRLEEWTGADHFLGIDELPRCQGETPPHIDFVRGVHIVRVADIDGNGHAGARQLKGHPLGLAQERQAALGHGSLVLVKARQLNKEKWQVAASSWLPLIPPILDQATKQSAIFDTATAVVLTLIPDDTANGEGRERGDHAIEINCGRARAASWSRYGHRVRIDGLGALGLGSGTNRFPGILVGVPLLQLRVVFGGDFSLPFFQLHLIVGGQLRIRLRFFILQHGLIPAAQGGGERGIFFQTGQADPSLDVRAAPCGLKHSHRHLLLVADDL